MNASRIVRIIKPLCISCILILSFAFFIKESTVQGQAFIRTDIINYELYPRSEIHLEEDSFTNITIQPPGHGTIKINFILEQPLDGTSEVLTIDVYLFNETEFVKYTSDGNSTPILSCPDVSELICERYWLFDVVDYYIVLENIDNNRSYDAVPVGNITGYLEISFSVIEETELMRDINASSDYTGLKILFLCILLSTTIFFHCQIKKYLEVNKKESSYLRYASHVYIALSFPSIIYYMFISTTGMNSFLAQIFIVIYLVFFMGMVYLYYFLSPIRILRIPWIKPIMYIGFGALLLLSNGYLIAKEILTLHDPDYGKNKATFFETMYQYLHEFFGLSVTLADEVTIFIMTAVLLVFFILILKASWLYTYELNMWGKGRQFRKGGESLHFLPYFFTGITAISVVVLFAFIFSDSEIDPTADHEESSQPRSDNSILWDSLRENGIQSYSLELHIITLASIGYILKLAGWGYGLRYLPANSRTKIHEEWAADLFNAIKGKKIVGKRAERILIDIICNDYYDIERTGLLLFEIFGMGGIQSLIKRYPNPEKTERDNAMDEKKRNIQRNIVKTISSLAGYIQNKRQGCNLVEDPKGFIASILHTINLITKDPNQIMDILLGFGYLQDAHLIPEIQKHLYHPDDHVKAEAIRALGMIDNTGAVLPELREMIKSDDTSAIVRTEIAQFLGRMEMTIDPITRTSLLKEMLSDENRNVRHAAIEALVQTDSMDKNDALSEILARNPPDMDMIQSILKTFVPGPNHVVYLFKYCDMIRTRDLNVRKLALEALARSHDGKTIGVFIDTIWNDLEEISAIAEKGLAIFKTNHPEPDIFLSMIESADPLVKKYGIIALGHVGGRNYSPVLLNHLIAEHPLEVRKSALIMLGEIGESSAISFIKIALEDDRLRTYAEKALRKIGTLEAMEILERWERKRMWKG